MVSEYSERVAEELRNSPAAMRVYLLLVSKSSPNPAALSLQEMAESLHLSKPAVHRQIQKLNKLDLLIETKDLKYKVKDLVPVGTLKAYISFRGRFFSRYLLYSLLFLVLIALMVTIQTDPLTPTGSVAYMGSVGGFALMLREHLRWCGL